MMLLADTGMSGLVVVPIIGAALIVGAPIVCILLYGLVRTGIDWVQQRKSIYANRSAGTVIDEAKKDRDLHPDTLPNASPAPTPTALPASFPSGRVAEGARWVVRKSRLFFWIGVAVCVPALLYGWSTPHGNPIQKFVILFSAEIGITGLMITVFASVMGVVCGKFIKNGITWRDRFSLGPMVIGGAVSVVMCAAFWASMLIGQHTDEFAFGAVAVMGAGIALGSVVRWSWAVCSPLRGSWLTRPLANTLAVLTFLELLLLGTIAMLSP